MYSYQILQTERENFYQNVSKVVDQFNDIWNILQSATNPNHKDKCYGELKNEIKNLQGDCDQIETWAASNDNEDHRLKSRSPIETQV